MESITRTIDIDCPVNMVYNQWTQFESLPRFMGDVKQVRQLDDTRVAWCVSIDGRSKEWEAKITEQVPDQLIRWRSTRGAPNDGIVRFEPIGGTRTRVTLEINYEPQGLMENIADALGAVARHVEESLEDFKEEIEHRGRETGAWRGEVHRGQTRSSQNAQRGHI